MPLLAALLVLAAPRTTALVAPPRRPLADAAVELRSLAALRPTREDLTALTEQIAVAPNPLRRFRRYQLLTDLLRDDPDTYVDVAGWLHRALGVPRADLPNLEGVAAATPPPAPVDDLVPDCALPNATFVDSPLDAFLLRFTRDRYAEHTPGPAHRSARPGILGLLDEMRVLMLDEAGTDDAQAALVHRVLLDLMTPALPPIYRLFVAGFVPSEARGDPKWLADLAARQPFRPPGARIFGGRLFYADFATSVVAPVVFGFLVGPARVNRRRDGARGGLVVDKCKFLQESNCKGLCLHQCKRPAERLFDELGVPLRVAPNFETQECQWSWGVAAPAPADDPTWPDACVSGCPNRRLLPAGRDGGGGARAC